MNAAESLRPTLHRLARIWWVVLLPLIPAVFVGALIGAAALSTSNQGEFQDYDSGAVTADFWLVVLIWAVPVYCFFCAPLAAARLWISRRAKRAAVTAAKPLPPED